jgi:hypothetical protein
MTLWAVGLGFVLGTLAFAVFHCVDFRCHDAKMLHVATRPYAASVIYHHAIGNRANVSLPHIPMNGSPFAIVT